MAPLRGALLAVVVVVVVLLCVHQRHQAFGYDTDKQYRYELGGMITAKVGDQHNERAQYAGASFGANVMLWKSSDDIMVVKLNEPKIVTFNEAMQDDIHLHKFNADDYRRLDVGDAVSLGKPFRIHYNSADGGVKSMDVYKDEPKWVTNFKRGLLSFFQLRLQPERSYAVQERSVFGECETEYTILDGSVIHKASGKEIKFMNVTKSRNLAKCKNPFSYTMMPLEANECVKEGASADAMAQFRHSNAVFNYNLRGDRASYVLEQALLSEQSRNSPFGPMAHTQHVHTKFGLQLLQESALDSNLFAVNNNNNNDDGSGDEAALKSDSLAYDPPEMINFYANVNLSEAHHLYHIYDQQAVSVEQLQALMDELVTAHKDYHEHSSNKDSGVTHAVQSQMGPKFVRLVELIGLLDMAKIEQLYYNVDSLSDQHKKLFFDAISNVGTNPSIMFMKKLIMDGDAPSVRVKDFLTRLSFHMRVPSKALIDEYVVLCKSDKIQSNLAYKRLCLLPLASLIHQHCAKPHVKYLRMQAGLGHAAGNATQYKKAQNACQLATAEEYFTQLVSSPQAADAESIGDKMLLVKLAGELGVKPTIDYLYQQYIKPDGNAGAQVHSALRSAAVWQLTKVAKLYPQQVKRLVAPLYYDTNECLEVRVAAFYAWLYSGVSLHELETIGAQLMREPDRQLVTYMYTLLTSAARMDAGIPCLHAFNEHAQQVLPVVKAALRRHTPYVSMWTDSQAHISTSWLKDNSYGTKSVMSKINCNESFAPANLHYSTTEIMRGIKLTTSRIDLQTHGVDKLLLRVLGINGMTADKESLLDLFALKRRSRRSPTSAELIKQEVQDIDKELKLNVRDFGDVYLAFTRSMYGRPVIFVDIDSKQLKRMASDDGTIKIPNVRKLLSAYTNYTVQQLQVPFETFDLFNNEMGLPLYRSMRMFDYNSFKISSIRMDVDPGFFRDERAGKPPTRVAASLDARYTKHVEVCSSSGLLLTALKQKFGAGMHKLKVINVPIKVSLDANLQDNKIVLKSAPIASNLLYIKQGPVTYNYTYDPTVRASLAHNSLPLYNLSDSQVGAVTQHEFMTPLAVGARIQARHRADSDWSASAWRRHLVGLGSLTAAKFHYIFSPTGSPLELNVSTITTDVNPTEESSTILSWHHHRHDSSSSHHVENDDEHESIDKELEAFTTSRPASAQSPVTVSYKLTKLGGSQKPRKLSLDIHYSRSHDRSAHKWHVFYQRTPIDQSASNNNNDMSEAANVCWSGQSQFPKYDIEKILALDSNLLDIDHAVNMSSQFVFGQECGSKVMSNNLGDSYFKMDAKFDWSAQQRQALSRVLSSNNKDMQQQQTIVKRNDDYRYLYEKCMRNRERLQNPIDQSCLYFLYRATELSHVGASFEHKNVPERWQRIASKLGALYTYARAGYINEMSDQSAYQSSGEARTAGGLPEDGHARLQANMSLSMSDRTLDYRIETPNKRVGYEKVPFSLPLLSTYPLFDVSYYQVLRKQYNMRFCSVGGNSVTTYDNKTIMLPNIADGCFKVISKDCSPENNFMVLGAKVGPGKVMKVYVGQKFKVEFVPRKDTGKVKEIKVNDETITVEKDKPFTQSMTIGNTSRTTTAFIIDYNSAFYTLTSQHYRFGAMTDGTWIQVQLSRYYAGRACGICGDNNGETLHELTTAEKVPASSTDEFIWSYVLPSTCASKPAAA